MNFVIIGKSPDQSNQSTMTAITSKNVESFLLLRANVNQPTTQWSVNEIDNSGASALASAPAGIKPTTFQLPVGCSNQWVMVTHMVSRSQAWGYKSQDFTSHQYTAGARKFFPTIFIVYLLSIPFKANVFVIWIKFFAGKGFCQLLRLF